MSLVRDSYIHALSLALLSAVLGWSCGVVGADEPHPDAVFAVDCTTIVDRPISFVNRSTNGVAYTWSFGDGRRSTEAAPSIAFAQTGDYNVTLVARNNSGAVDSMTRRVRVFATPPPEKILGLGGVVGRGSSWAVVTAHILAVHGVHKQACELDAWVTREACCQDTLCNPFAQPSNIVAALRQHGNLIANEELGAMSFDEIRLEIAQDRPVALWYSANDTYQSLIAYGYDDEMNVYLFDPQRGATLVEYTSLDRYRVGLDFLDWTGSVQCVRRLD